MIDTAASEDRYFPAEPFESIAFALSGGGFRAATYGLGVLSMLDTIKIDGKDQELRSSLLQKIKFVSSASGGTITLALYSACLHSNISFGKFFVHLNNQLEGEKMVHAAVGKLADDKEWIGSEKSRNIINAFSKMYHEHLFSIIEPSQRVMGLLMDNETHLEEVCFNATEFYTGLPFRFQAGSDWKPNRGGRLGNNNIRINKAYVDAELVLKKLRLSDVLACSSCFPMGFEPMVYPKDFTYTDGPDLQQFKKSLSLRTYCTEVGHQPDTRSPRALKEKQFADNGIFGLMDGGICDNQALDSLLEANKRDPINTGENNNRFDLIMVSDVASFYMDPYETPLINSSSKWMTRSLSYFWDFLHGIHKKIFKARRIAFIIAFIIAIAGFIPLVLDEQGAAEIILAVAGVVLFILVIWISGLANRYLGKSSQAGAILSYPTIAALIKDKLPPAKGFQNQVAGKLTEYFDDIEIRIIFQMMEARVRSSVTMIGEIFLKHIRRLIFEQLFTDPKLKYRRLNNVIYKLTFTNNENRKNPSFESERKDFKEEDLNRRKAFLNEWNDSVHLTEEMQTIAELAYNTGTTLWFEQYQESDPKKNNRRALLATGQFTTCYNLIGYTLSLKHSRNFERLDQFYKNRIISIAAQLKLQLQKFKEDPYWLVKEYEQIPHSIIK